MESEMRPKLYLAGPITGESYGGATNWRDWMKWALPEVACFSPMRGKKDLSGEADIRMSYEESAMSCAKGICARDFYDVESCDAMVMNLLGADRVSIGSMLEAGFAHALRKPMILAIGVPYRHGLIDDDSGDPHDHAMLLEIAGFVVGSLEDAAAVAEGLLLP